MKSQLIYSLMIITLGIIPFTCDASPVETATPEVAQDTINHLPPNTLIAQATVGANNTASPPHFYVKLQRMNMNKKECKRLAKEAMRVSGFIDLTHGKHGIWGVREGYKTQIKCSQAEQVIVFIVVGQQGPVVMKFSDQLQKNFGTGFSITRDP